MHIDTDVPLPSRIDTDVPLPSSSRPGGSGRKRTKGGGAVVLNMTRGDGKQQVKCEFHGKWVPVATMHHMGQIRACPTCYDLITKQPELIPVHLRFTVPLPDPADRRIKDLPQILSELHKLRALSLSTLNRPTNPNW